MDFGLTRTQQLWQKAVREFAERRLAPRAVALDDGGQLPRELVKEMGSMGYLGVVTPEEHGGTALGHVARMLMIEEISRVYPPFGFFYQAAHLGIYALEQYGSDRQKERYLASLVSGDTVSCMAVTEQTGGSDPANMRTRARPSGGDWVLSGRKAFITLGKEAEVCLVLARTGQEGFSVFLVEKGTPGFNVTRREAHMGMRSVPVYEMEFDGCRVPGENLVGTEGRGLGAALSVIAEIGRTGAIAVALGIARGALDMALGFARQRELYGKPIASFQGIQFMLADMDTQYHAARLLGYLAASLLDQGKKGKEIALEISRAKVFGCEAAMANATRAIQIHGACATTPEYGLGRRMADALELLAAGGTQEIMRVTIAKGLVG
jgi:alkylation response protein AidB-like acyl-CoA dehydrogenase